MSEEYISDQTIQPANNRPADFFETNPRSRTHIQLQKGATATELAITRSKITDLEPVQSQPFVAVSPSSDTADYTAGGDFGITGVRLQTPTPMSAAVTLIVTQTRD